MLPSAVPLAAAATAAAAIIAGSYTALCRRLRYARMAACNASHNPHSVSATALQSSLGLSSARAIVSDLYELEFPWTCRTALQFALFRTYAIPSISRVLQRTGQLCTAAHAGRRYADTCVLIAEFLAWPLDSERAALALARINYLHRAHPEILPRDLLYTLLLFATQPLEFVNRFEWRTATPLEEAACWRLWSEVGVRMGIPADTIPASYADMVAAYKRYEEEFMVPAETNAFVATRTVELLLYWVPGEPAKRLARQLVYAICDARLRTAMLFPDPAPWAAALLPVLLGARRLLLATLALPRTDANKVLTVSDRPGENGRYFVKKYDNEPWYVPATVRNRWGLWGLVSRVLGLPIAGTRGYGEDGYEIETVGPTAFKKAGVETVRKEAAEIMKMGGGAAGEGGRCPF